MNKLLLNEKGRNHIKFFPMKDAVGSEEIPDTDKDRILWCESEYKRLRISDDAENLVTYKNRARGYLISVWQLNTRYYLIQCIRNAAGAFNDTIYISNEKDDLLSIARFLKENIETIMSDYKEQITDARNALVAEAIKEHYEGTQHTELN